MLKRRKILLVVFWLISTTFSLTMALSLLSPAAKELEGLALRRELPLRVALPMTYGRHPLTDAHKALRPKGLRRLTADDVSSPLKRAAVACLYVGLDCLDEAHDLVAGDSGEGTDAAYVHAVLHRREGPLIGELGLTGYQNARYWFGILGNTHPAFQRLPREIEAMAAVPPEALPLRRGPWDPDLFVALCERAVRANDANLLAFCRAVQQREWEILYAHLIAKMGGGENAKGPQ
mmetsp:Transcript_32628/g.104041  ORF Transcript_32628/g.104041 Transcript_32628/m.104041 type:complete len:234 (-) Transcript_32628:148-849(-)